MLEESKKLVKDTANRLGTAVQDLRDLLVSRFPLRLRRSSNVTRSLGRSEAKR